MAKAIFVLVLPGGEITPARILGGEETTKEREEGRERNCEAANEWEIQRNAQSRGAEK